MKNEQPDARVAIVRGTVERACLAPENVFGYSIWTHHIVWVERYGLELAQVLGANPLTVQLAALLHDYAGIKAAALAPAHHLYGVEETARVLGELGYPADLIRAVQHCVLTHRASQSLKPETLEAVCLASADAMAHIAQVPSLLHLAYARRGLGVDAGVLWVRGKLERSYRKLCPEAQEMIGARYEGALELLTTA